MKWFSVFCAVALLTLIGADAAQAQHSAESHDEGSGQHAQMPLEAPGNDIFGTVQEAIRTLEADPDTDWSQVDMERLRQHLIDMHHVAMNVAVVENEPIEGGVRLVVEPTVEAARASLERVLKAHPTMLEHDAGWQMRVEPSDGQFVLTVTDPEGTAADKIRGLGYIGLLAYGPHHQHHHWMMVRGQAPHSH